MNHTRHSAKRVQQRGIPPLILDWLMEYGAVAYSHGAEKRYFDKNARKRLARDVGEQVVSHLGRLLDIYVVVGDNDRLVTAGHRHSRIRQQ